MKNTKNILWALPLFSILFFTACEKNDPDIPNEEELITTLIYTLTPQQGGTTVELIFEDLDGDGGNAPVISNGTLVANTTYIGVLRLLNETESPAKNITEEVAEEAEAHQVFYRLSNGSFTGGLSYSDVDENGNPIGIQTNFATGSPLSTNLTITLRHEPDKEAEGVSNGDISNAGGETDIEVTFDVIVL